MLDNLNHQHFLYLAADLAMSVDPHSVSPNPRVGCIVVKNGIIIGQGAHEKKGENHAEVNALETLSETDVMNSVVYVTLEPCADFIGKRTPSCSNRFLKIPPKGIVVGALDPKWNGENLKMLSQSGIETKYIPHKKCQQINPFFEYFTQYKKPWITLKIAQSVNGKATNPDKKWLTNLKSRQLVHVMRAHYSGIITSAATIRSDACHLNTRLGPDILEFPHSDSDVLILGSQKNISKDAPIFQYDRCVHSVPGHNLSAVIEHAAALKLDSLMTEFGPRLASAFLTEQIPDELVFFLAPEIYATGMNWFSGYHDVSNYSLMKVKNIGGDVFLQYLRKNHLNAYGGMGTMVL